MSIREKLKEKREDILRIATQNGASNVRLYGSVARGEEGPESDVDFLVDMEEGRSILDLSVLWQDMEELLGCSVHVTEVEGLHWYIRDRILEEVVPL